MRWNRPDPRPRIEPGQIHVWRARLDDPSTPEEAARAALSPAEARRADRFRFPLHRRRWVVSRAALRAILGAYLGRPPAAIEFERGPGGKPFLAGRDGDLDLRFNLAHSGEWAAIAVALGRDVGIDVERMRRDAPILDLARRWFAPEEVEGLLAVPAGLRSAAFFACWTRKEAVVKAEGETVPAALRRFAVPVDPLAAEVRALGPGRAWSVATLDVGAGYAAALAFEAPAETRRYRWSG